MCCVMLFRRGGRKKSARVRSPDFQVASCSNARRNYVTNLSALRAITTCHHDDDVHITPLRDGTRA